MLSGKVCVKSFRVRNAIHHEDGEQLERFLARRHMREITSRPFHQSHHRAIKQPLKGRATYRAAH